MPGLEFQQTQRVSQIQTQRMSQQQIYSLNLLAMSSQDLRSEIYAAVDKNPALEISQDPLASGTEYVRKVTRAPADYLHIGKTSAAGELKSDNFQDILESKADERETLQDHLLSQLNVMKLSSGERELGIRLIENLDTSGFHILAPDSLLDGSHPAWNRRMLDKCIDIIRRLDPVGTCCTNIQESLYVQAIIRKDAPAAALFILNGHFDFLDPPLPVRILKKIEAYVKEQAELSFAASASGKNQLDTISRFSIKDIEAALSFIKTLDPHPARQFGASGNIYVVPDVYVTRIPVSIENDDFERNLVASGRNFSFRVSLADNVLPNVELSSVYIEAKPEEVTRSDKKFITSAVREAKVFIENLNFRENTIGKACCAIVRAQIAFFEKGPRYLVPLRQKDIADVIGVHEATVSRMANSKYLQCEWGLFAIKYFFTGAVAQTSVEPSEEDRPDRLPATGLSKESVKYEIKQILASQQEDDKPFSDQKIADLLESRGIKVARRTVAKYRAELKIDSSYLRER